MPHTVRVCDTDEKVWLVEGGVIVAACRSVQLIVQAIRKGGTQAAVRGLERHAPVVSRPAPCCRGAAKHRRLPPAVPIGLTEPG